MIMNDMLFVNKTKSKKEKLVEFTAFFKKVYSAKEREEN